MNTTTEPAIELMGDLCRRLGDIPPDRVRSQLSPGSATIEDLLRPENACCELVDGTLVEKAVGVKKSYLAGFIRDILSPYVRLHNLGMVTQGDGPWELISGIVRLPDVAFVSWNRLPNAEVPDDPVPNVVPDLAVEVISRSNTRSEIARKRGEYFQSGVRLVWEIEPRLRTVRVYRSFEVFEDLSDTDSLDGGEVIPGFSLSVAQLWKELDRRGNTKKA